MSEKFEKSTQDRRKLYTLLIEYRGEIKDKGNITSIEINNPQAAYIGGGRKRELFLCRASNRQDTAVLISMHTNKLISDGESISPIPGGRYLGAINIYCPSRDSISQADKQKREGFLRILGGLGL